MDGTEKSTRNVNAKAPGTSAGPPLPQPTAEEKREERHRHIMAEATAARDYSIPCALSRVIGEESVSVSAARVYLNTFQREAGNPTDPIEKMVLEQLVLVHHRLAKLHVQASAATEPEQVKVYNTAATRLLGEMRRLSLAIRQYRTPVSGRSFSVVHQQNVVTGSGGQQVSYVDQSAAGQDRVTFAARDEVESKATAGVIHEPDSTPKEPPTGSRWADERIEAESVVS